MPAGPEYKINWKYYPSNIQIPDFLRNIATVFGNHYDEIYTENRKNALHSNEVLDIISADLETAGFQVEKSKKKEDKIPIPVLFGEQGKMEKSFDVDAWHPELKIDIEVEAGRGFTNYQFLKDFFEACIMIEVDYLVIAVKNNNIVKIKGKESVFYDYNQVIAFFNSLYASSRLNIPLKGILIIGY